MFRLVESSEDLNHSLPVVGANILNILKSNKDKISIYRLLDATAKQNPEYGYETITQSLIFLYTIGTIDLNGAYIEVKNENR
ncbi:ABC-three component system middle component 6 [Vibrio splendidus]|uniref:ABC-three component system middle component 6 n=1 Tax=Vibrio splendidus TaxID=29497 RepID=UPI000D397FC1|nr:hypothetical protein CWO03_22320 [Vibrio splendidus]